jgi:hypothetical protein
MALGAMGLASFLLVQVLALDRTTLPHGIGALERGAAYPVLATEILVGVSLLIESLRLRRRALPDGAAAATVAA